MDNVPPSKRLFCGRSENDREKFRYIGTIDVRIFDEGPKIPFTVGLANLLVLTGLGVYGLTRWDTNQLVAGITPRPAWSSLIGGAAIFMGYAGFQLLCYDRDF